MKPLLELNQITVSFDGFIALENLNDCVLNDSELNFSKNEKNQFRYSYSVFFDFDIFQRYLSRAPPIS